VHSSFDFIGLAAQRKHPGAAPIHSSIDRTYLRRGDAYILLDLRTPLSLSREMRLR
jgi:hypothetical protein